MAINLIKDDSDYSLRADGSFVIKNYNQKKPFSNFLPGVAGFYGIPLWVFYVNRGQCISSFGIKNKDDAFLEFFPANKAYQTASLRGFRTFIKLSYQGKEIIYEPFGQFSSYSCQKFSIEQRLIISSHELCLEDINSTLGLKINVRYFTIPNEPLGALARQVTLTNLKKETLRLELIDGLPMVNPYGMNEFFSKHMSRTIEAWMAVENMENKAPYFHLKVDATDRPEVTSIEEGNFYFSIMADKSSGAHKLLEPIVDPKVVFGTRLDFGYPEAFEATRVFEVPNNQSLHTQTPSAMVFTHLNLSFNESKSIRSFYGNASHKALLNDFVKRAVKSDYFPMKAEENKFIIDQIKQAVFTVTSSRAYDLYCGQTYLDNVIRGGMPIYLDPKEKRLPFYVYSRKHGDLERDYNRFLVEPTYFSQGDGNYRDVNQNRRNDVWFNPQIKDINIKIFLNLIQLDGFNPLVIKGSCYHFIQSAKSRQFLSKTVSKSKHDQCEVFFKNPFTPGELYLFMTKTEAMSRPKFAAFLAGLAPFLQREDRAEFGEGYWADHWTYNLDLIESYLAIYPEDSKNILFERREYTFYDSDHRVASRHEKYCLHKDNQIRQFKSVRKDAEKAQLISRRDRLAHWTRLRKGKGDIFRTTLFVKLLSLICNKFASVDAQGVGVEMESDRPGWLDALNGLPGLLGSSTCETAEVKRLCVFLIQAIEDFGVDAGQSVLVPEEIYEFYRKLQRLLSEYFKSSDKNRDFVFWDKATAAKEDYRRSVRLGISGEEKKVKIAEWKRFFEEVKKKTDLGLEKAFNGRSQLINTYYENEVVDYRTVKKSAKELMQDDKNQPESWYEPKSFQHKPLPLFLEGIVHAMKVEKDPSRRRAMVRSVRESRIYDKKLGMYKMSEPIDTVSFEIGRLRVFAPGWLENESVWLHMEYKFMLEMLKAGLSEEYFEDFKRALIPFQPSARYGRSLLENSSFIASSAFSDASIHGTGFVARLSGSTTELIHMWLLMNVGKRPFIIGPDGKLSLRFEPTLPEFLFTKELSQRSRIRPDSEREEIVTIPKDCVAFTFLGKTLVVYYNPRRLDTFGKTRASVRKITLTTLRGQEIEFKGDTIPSPYAEKVREDFIPRIDIELG